MPKPISFDKGIVLLLDLTDMLRGLIKSPRKGRQISVSAERERTWGASFWKRQSKLQRCQQQISIFLT